MMTKLSTNRIKVIVAICLCVVAVVAGIVIGSIFISPMSIWGTILHNIFGIDLHESVSAGHAAIVWHQRLPRTLLAFIAGAALSVSGAVMQSVLRNPLASSYTLGVSSGASLGAAMVILVGITLPFLPAMSLPIFGFTFGLVTILIVMAVARQLNAGMDNHTIILTGMVFALFINSVTTLMFTFFREGVENMVFWQMGSFRLRGWTPVYILFFVTLAGVLLVRRYRWELDVMTFGEEQAQTIGVNIKRVKLVLLIAAAALTGSTIAFVGIIGFVDLVTPHVVRKIFGASHRAVIPMSAALGGTFMVIADTLARTVMSPVELPVGAITAVIGAPFFGYVFFSKRKKG